MHSGCNQKSHNGGGNYYISEHLLSPVLTSTVFGGWEFQPLWETEHAWQEHLAGGTALTCLDERVAMVMPEHPDGAAHNAMFAQFQQHLS